MPQIKVKTDNNGRTVIYDTLRRLWVVMTPEEFVRQQFVNHLIDQLGYPRGRMANEVALQLNGTSRRADTVLFGMDRRPLAIIEYKAPEVALTQKVFDQIVRYNMVLRARYLMVSNGRSSYCCRVDYSSGGVEFLEAIPRYEELL